jgi:hypothetical protein
LTIERNDFDAPTLAVDIGAAASGRVDVLFGIEYSRTTINSEYRHLVDNNRLPIAQRTRLQQMNLSTSAKIARYPAAGRWPVAWILVPWRLRRCGRGLSAVSDQSGRLCRFRRLSVSRSPLRSSGWTPSAHVFAGADIKLRDVISHRRSAVSLGAGAAGMDFSGFASIDLSGAKVTAGVNLLF